MNQCLSRVMVSSSPYIARHAPPRYMARMSSKGSVPRSALPTPPPIFLVLWLLCSLTADYATYRKNVGTVKACAVPQAKKNDHDPPLLPSHKQCRAEHSERLVQEQACTRCPLAVPCQHQMAHNARRPAGKLQVATQPHMAPALSSEKRRWCVGPVGASLVGSGGNNQAAGDWAQGSACAANAPAATSGRGAAGSDCVSGSRLRVWNRSACCLCTATHTSHTLWTCAMLATNIHGSIDDKHVHHVAQRTYARASATWAHDMANVGPSRYNP